MTEKKLCVYEIEDVFKTYDLLIIMAQAFIPIFPIK